MKKFRITYGFEIVQEYEAETIEEARKDAKFFFDWFENQLPKPELKIVEIDSLTCPYCERIAPEKEFLTKNGCKSCDTDYDRDVRQKGKK